jgi:hypothetical protein
MMRRRLPLLLTALPLCVLPGCAALVPWAAAEAVSMMVFDRSIGDLVVSAATGRDCSVVRLDMGESYYRAEEAPPDRQPVCTRSLGAVDCWRVPPHAWPPHRGLADGPGSRGDAQGATGERTSNDSPRRWPNLF